MVAWCLKRPQKLIQCALDDGITAVNNTVNADTRAN